MLRRMIAAAGVPVTGSELLSSSWVWIFCQDGLIVNLIRCGLGNALNVRGGSLSFNLRQLLQIRFEMGLGRTFYLRFI
jgi:hypothetical protein